MKLYSCFIDFTKAFDNVWRIELWQKLMKHNIKGKVLNVTKICMQKLNHVYF